MEKNIWDFYAPVYDFFMKKDELKKDFMYKRIKFIIKDKNVLELATGTGILAKNVSITAKSMIATDFSLGMIKEAKKGNYSKNLNFEIADATNLKYSDNFFDVVIISNALHIMKDAKSCLKEIFRVLKKDGILIAPNFIVKNKKSTLWIKFLKFFALKFENEWNEKEYLTFLQENGFFATYKMNIDTKVPTLYVECQKKELLQ